MAVASVRAHRGTPTAARRTGRLALLLIAISVGLQVVVGRLGTSVAVPPLSAGQSAVGSANAWLVTGLLAAALVVGAVGTLLGLRALRAGWSPSPIRLLAGGAVAVLVLLLGPPLGTADLGGYAAYGRMSVLHRDPYTTTPRQLAGDPVADAAEAPWRDVPSIYGPAATAEFRLAAELGGRSRATVLRLLAGAAGVAFLATAALLDRMAGRNGRAARRRAALLWVLNPLLLYQLVAGAHLDALVALFVLAGVAVLVPRPRDGWSGALFGLAALVKATALAPIAGVVVAHLIRWRSSPRPGIPVLRRFGVFAAAGLAVVAVGYAAVGGLHAVTPTREASRMVSRGTPWRFVASGLEQVLPHDAARTVVGLAAVLLAAWLAVRVFRLLPPAVAADAGADNSGDGGGLALRCALSASLAWLVVAPYALPWYDAMGWALLAVPLAAPGNRKPPESAGVSVLERLLLLHTAVLSVAYLPGRVIGLPHSMVVAQDIVRGGLAPVVVLVVIVGLAGGTVLTGRRSPFRSTTSDADREAVPSG